MNFESPDPAGPVRSTDVFDVRSALLRIWDSCRIHAWLVVFCPLLTVGLITFYVLNWQPIYVAEAVLLAEPERDSSREQFYYFWNMFRKEDVKSEVSLMTSTAVVAEVVKKLNLTYDDVYHPFLNHAAYLWTQSTVGRTYRRVKQWFFPPKPGPYVPTEAEVDFARTVADFKEGVSITPVPESHVGALTLKGPSPRVAEIANALIHTSLEHRRRRYIEEATHAYNAVKAETDKVYAELKAREESRRQFYADNGLLMELEREKIDVTNYASLEASLGTLRTELAGLEQKKALLQRLLANEPSETITQRTVQRNPLRQEVERLKTTLEAQLADNLVRYREDAPEIVELRKRIAAFDGLLKSMAEEASHSSTRAVSTTREALDSQLKNTEVEIAGKRATLEAKEKLLSTLRPRLTEIPRQIIELRHLGREESGIEKKYVILQERLMMAEVSISAARSAPASLKVVDFAETPSKPAWPQNKLLFPAALLLGLFAGVTLAVCLDLLASRVTEARLKSQAAEYPLFGTIREVQGEPVLDLQLARLRVRSLPE